MTCASCAAADRTVAGARPAGGLGASELRRRQCRGEGAHHPRRHLRRHCPARLRSAPDGHAGAAQAAGGAGARTRAPGVAALRPGRAAHAAGDGAGHGDGAPPFAQADRVRLRHAGPVRQRPPDLREGVDAGQTTRSQHGHPGGAGRAAPPTRTAYRSCSAAAATTSTSRRPRASSPSCCSAASWRRRAKGKASEAIRKLIELQPATATVLRDGGEAHDRRSDDLRVGDRGAGAARREGPDRRRRHRRRLARWTSPCSPARACPCDKAPGTAVVGGTRQRDAARFDVRATARRRRHRAARRSSAWSRRPRAAKPPIQRLADRVAAVFVPAVLGARRRSPSAVWLAGRAAAARRR
ncbi:MAG: hypothetical protein MZW92_64070 [Comamonadaceae bacterium]|nr:hypothetical protein [Comamonadaceae bacterium]